MPSGTPFKSRDEYLFLFGVGGAYLYAVNRVILSATVIEFSPMRLYITGLFFLLLFTVIFFNRYTRLITVGLIVAAVFLLLLRRDAMTDLFEHFYDLYLWATGYLPPHRDDLWRTMTLLVCGAFGFTTVIFMLYRFSFTVLSLGGGTIFALSWITSFVRDTASFMVFLFAFILIFVRKANKSVSVAALAAPLCFIVMLAAHIYLPAYSEVYTRRTLRDAFEGPMAAVEDFFYEFFNPTYFSFANTGFSGASGRLGGPVQVNHRHVMDIEAPGQLYLSGATRNHFTGEAWTDTLREGDIDTHGLPRGNFEMLETAAALIRDAGLTRGTSGLSAGILRTRFPMDSAWDLIANQFAVAGMYAEGLFDRITGESPEPGEYELWRDEWTLTNPQYGVVPEPDDQGRVRYYRHVYLPMQTVSVFSGRNRTGTVFQPPASRLIRFDESGPDYTDSVRRSPAGDLSTPGFMGRGTVYHHQFLHVNPHLTFVEDILNQSRQGLYAARENTLAAYIMGLPPNDRNEERTAADTLLMDGVFQNFMHHGTAIDHTVPGFANQRDLIAFIDAFSVDTLAAYAENIRTHFMYVPATVPQRVHDLTMQIIRDETTDFGRVTAIRDYLLFNYTYTLSPSPLPRGACFVDYFLFEGREGYCTYFASAMAIMSRIAGVPSRYVEGFFVPGTNRHDHSVTAVTNRMAHAWAEVYFEGFGWLIMEATPPYAFETGTAAPQSARMNRTDWESWDDRMLDPDEWWWHYMQQNQGASPANPLHTASAPETRETGIPLLYSVILLILALFLTAAIAVFVFLSVCRIRFTLALKRIRCLSPNHQAQIFFKGILNISEYYHLPMEKGETTLAYGKRAGKRFAFRSDAVFLRDLIAVYNRAKYGYKQISEKERGVMEESYFAMLDLLRAMRWRPYYLYLRYIKRVGNV
ncbi:MAG: transglutaminase-like domain-containing protein [Defluviitaleaceae bacterium]|nr:transglutaminase-like domain-containing protein [Defluviitaleaceae bacterium]